MHLSPAGRATHQPARLTYLLLMAIVASCALSLARPQVAAATNCDTLGAPTTTVYLPNITKSLGGPDGWVTPFIVQNVGTTTATLEVSFYAFGSGSLVTCRKVNGVAPGTSFADVPNNDADLPGNSQFSVVVRSFGSQVVSVVNEHQGSGERAEALSYVGLTTGATRVALPYVAKAVDGWLTTIVMQNLGAATATVTASFANHDATRTATLTRTISSGRSEVIDPTVESMLVSGTEYAVILRATQPIAVVANAHNNARTTVRPKSFSYNGIVAAPGDSYLPWAGRNAEGTGRSTSILMQNIGSADATPTLVFRRIGGMEQAVVTAPAPIQPGRRWAYVLPSVPTDGCPSAGTATCPRDGEHSVVVTGGEFAVLAYSIDTATALAVSAGPPAPARTYLPNVTRTLGGSSGWTTPIVLQSGGAKSAALRWYRFADGALAVTQYVSGLTSGASIRIDPRTVSGLTDDTQYAVVVDAGGPARAIVLEDSQSGGDGAMAYEGFPAITDPAPSPSVTFSFDAGVTAKNESDIRAGVSLGASYVQRTLGGDISRSITVFGHTGTSPYGACCFARGNTEFHIYVEHFVWNTSFVAPVDVERRKIATHEYIHLWQSARNCVGWPTVPVWFYEGMAEYGGFAAIIDAGLISASQVRSYQIGGLRQTPSDRTLQSTEATASDYSVSLVYMALDRLLIGRDFVVLRHFCDTVAAGQDWRQAFLDVFGVSVPDFYVQFEEYRKNPT